MSAEADPDAQEEPRKKGMLVPLIIGLVLALVGGGGGFFVVQSGMLAGLIGDEESSEEMAEDTEYEDDGGAQEYVSVSFVPLETVVISLGQDAGNAHLIFSAELEVSPDYVEEVTALTPRILDVLNSYLRIVGVDELSRPAALSRLRAQMLHRIQIVTGEGRVRDLLITEFVVN